MAKKKARQQSKGCSYPGCDRSDVGLVLLDDGHYAPVCAEHAAAISNAREKKRK